MRSFKKTSLSIGIAAVLSLVYGAAMAGDASNATIMSGSQMITQGVSGSVNSANISITNAVNNTKTTLSSDLNNLGNMIAGEFKTQDELLGNLAKTQIQSMRDLMVAQEIAAAKQRAIETYGDQATDPICNTEQLGQSVSAGRVNMQNTIISGGSSMEQRSRSGPGTKGSSYKVKDLLELEEDKMSLEDMYPQSGTLTTNQKKSLAQIHERVIDPFPPNKISPRVKNTPLGEKYEGTRKLYEGTKAAPRQAQLIVDSMKANDFPVNEWAKGAWADMGKSGDPEGTDPETKNMSYDAFIALFIKSRIDNPEWYKKFDTMNDSWQLRQINMNSAMLLEIQYRQMKLLEHLVELQAQQRANEIDKEYGRNMDELLRRAESTQ